MAALMVADELAETARRLRRLEEEIAALQDARVVSADRAKAASAAVVNAFNSAAERIEGITKKLNQTLGNARGDGVSARQWRRTRINHYIRLAGLRGATETHSPGPYDPNGSCPWPGSWVRSYGAHLLM